MFLRALWGPWEGHATPKPSYRQVALLSPDPQLYQEIRERGLNTSQESDDDILDEPSSPGGTQRADTTIVVKSYRPAQLTWSQLPEVRSPTPILNTQEAPGLLLSLPCGGPGPYKQILEPWGYTVCPVGLAGLYWSVFCLCSRRPCLV